MKTVVSILLPVWNAEKTLRTALASVQRQRFVDWECLIVDDGSSDDSLRISEEFARGDPRFRLVSRSHAGLIESLNAGIDLCEGSFVARMDADDWMHRDRLLRQVEWLGRSPELAAVGSFVRIFPRGPMKPGRRAYEAWLHSLIDPERLWRERFIECPIAHPTLMIRREDLVALRYQDRGWPEDFDLLLRLLRRGPVAALVPERLHGWRDLPSRLSRTDHHYALARFTACRAWHLSQDFLGARKDYVLWGYGPTGRALRRELANLGHHPSTIIDVHPRRIGNTIHGAKVVGVEDLDCARSSPLIASVAGADPRGEIRTALNRERFREGYDYVFAA